MKTKQSLPFEDALVLNLARIRDKRISVALVTVSFVALGVFFALLLKTSRSQTRAGPRKTEPGVCSYIICSDSRSEGELLHFRNKDCVV